MPLRPPCNDRLEKKRRREDLNQQEEAKSEMREKRIRYSEYCFFSFGLGPNLLVGPDRIVTETVKGPFSWTDDLGPVRLTEDRSVFVEP